MTIPTDEPRWARLLYALAAPFYDRIRPYWIARESEADLDHLLRSSTGPGARVLELAPGTGENLRRLLRLQPVFGSYLGVDVSPAMLSRARRIAPADQRVCFVEADAAQPEEVDWPSIIPAQDGTDPDPRRGPPFDLVLSTWFLAHLHQPRDTVASALRLLAPGGTAIFLFFVEPRARLRRWLVGIFVAAFRGRFVDDEPLKTLPHFIDQRTYPAARLLIFRRPSR